MNGTTKAIIGNFLDVMPMIPGTPVPGGGSLQVNGDGTVFDPVTGATWIQNANVAATFAADPALLKSIGMKICNGVGTVNTVIDPCMNADGTMNHSSAEAFVAGLRAIDYLGHNDWVLPPVPTDAITDLPLCSGFDCASSDNPMGSLFYNQLDFSRGGDVALSAAATGPFVDIQPYLYWACPTSTELFPAAQSSRSPNPQCASVQQGGTCGADFDWSFDFGNGFQGTDVAANDLFVTAYFVNVPEPPSWSILLAALGILGALPKQRSRCTAEIGR
jgi:hypothetical protein